MDSKIKKIIEKVDVVSFDIFDTLLLRYYIKPTDLFLHIEKAKNLYGFCAERIDAEKRCRIKNSDREDITFDDIYTEIDDKFKIVKKTELEFEKRALHANTQIKPLFEYAKKLDKKIIITSDMYLPKYFLIEMLTANGFSGFDDIFISGELNKTKGSGTLFKHILDKYDIKPHKIFHIGDNEKSDYKAPQKLGVQCRLYPKISCQYFHKFKYLKKFQDKHSDSLAASLFISQIGEYLLLKSPKNDYWYEIGYKLGGIIAYAYTNFIKKEVEKHRLTKLLFVARDGFILQKAYNMYGSVVKNAYVYAPRILRYIYDLKVQTNHDAKRIIDFYADCNDDIRNVIESSGYASNPMKILENYKELFLSKRYNKNFTTYIQNFTSNGDNIGIVDTITGEFSSQYLISKAINRSIYGLYWSNICPCRYDFKFSCFKNNKNFFEWNSNVFTLSWDFMEFLLSSPEVSIKYIDDSLKPVYAKNPPKEELYRASLYPEIANGILDFVRDFVRLSGEYFVDISSDMLISYINMFLKYRTPSDIKNLKSICFSGGFDHKKYYPIFPAISASDYFMHPLRTYRILKNIHSDLLSFRDILFCNIIKPVSVKIKSKYTKVEILPKLQLFFVKVKISIIKKYDFMISIGGLK